MITAITPGAEHHKKLGPMDSRVVHANDMKWEPIKYPGCYVKTLMIDPKNGLLTVLLKMDPGARLPDHEHAMVEQTYMISGKLVDLEGPEKGLEVGPGEFVYRPAGSRHAAWTPDGGVMVAIFQVPNKFFETDGSVVDLVGNEWGAKWGHVLS
jgi:quercetin dioxygenase-like cupin family protein